VNEGRSAIVLKKQEKGREQENKTRRHPDNAVEERKRKETAKHDCRKRSSSNQRDETVLVFGQQK
jgi:hypothetical protein